MKYLVLGFLFLLSSCGYRIHKGNEQAIRSLTLIKVENKTYEARLSNYVMSRVRNAISSDNRFKLVEQAADAEIKCTISSYMIKGKGSAKQQSSDKEQQRYTTNYWAVEIILDFSVYEGDKVSLKFSTTGSGFYTKLSDLNSARQDAIKQACHVAALQMLDKLAMAW